MGIMEKDMADRPHARIQKWYQLKKPRENKQIRKSYLNVYWHNAKYCDNRIVRPFQPLNADDVVELMSLARNRSWA